MGRSKQTYLLAGKALEKFQSLYRDHWNVKSNGKVVRELEVNVVRDKYTMADIIEHIGKEQLWKIIDYYFTWWHNPDLTWFFYNYEKILQDMKWYEEDREKLARLRRETNKRVVERLKREQ